MQNLAMGIASALSAAAAPASAAAPAPQTTNNINMDSSNWMSRFQSTINHYQENHDQYWTPEETLLSNAQYTVKYVGALLDRDIFDVFVHDINKHYEIVFETDPFDKITTNKYDIKEDLANSIIANFESQMITHENTTNSIMVHNGDNLTISSEGHINLNSSENFFDMLNGNTYAQSEFSPSELQQYFQTAEADRDYAGRAIYSNYFLNSINYLPIIGVTNPPIKWAAHQLGAMFINEHYLHPADQQTLVILAVSDGSSASIANIKSMMNSFDDSPLIMRHTPTESANINQMLNNNPLTFAISPIALHDHIFIALEATIKGVDNEMGTEDISQIYLEDLYARYNVTADVTIYAQ